MHLALYRKWRPKTFDEVCGQEHITSILKYQVANGKHSHAYLFSGSRGTGKTSCAKILAKALNCLDPQNGNPCGKCSSCLAIDAGTALDVVEMDAASNNRVDDIREIRDDVVYQPAELRYRVFIVDEVHMLTDSAFNALLKTLEEPPEYMVFILATTEQHQLPATIISRCQRYDFHRIPASVIASHLSDIAKKEGASITDDGALSIAKLANGGMRDAIGLLELCVGKREEITASLVADTLGICKKDILAELAEAVAKKNIGKIFEITEKTEASSKDIQVFWQDIISFWRDMLVVKTHPSSFEYLGATKADHALITASAALFETSRILYHCKLLDSALFSMQKMPFSRRNTAELTLVRMADTSLSDTPDALLARIDELENKISRISRGGVSDTAAPIEKKAEDEPLCVISAPDEQNGTEASKAEAVKTEDAKTPDEEVFDWWEEARGSIRSAISPFARGFVSDIEIYKENGKYILPVPGETPCVVLNRQENKAMIVDVMSRYSGEPLNDGNVIIRQEKPKVKKDEFEML